MGPLVEYRDETGDCGMLGGLRSCVAGGIEIAGNAPGVVDLDILLSAAFRLAERRPAGSEDLGLVRSAGALPDVAGLLPSSEGRGRGPSLTLGLVYWA